MAKVELLVPHILKWEGGSAYSNIRHDKGGPTKYGITLETWKHVGYDKNKDGVLNEKDIKLLTEKDFQMVLKKNFWDRWKADEIKSQSLANMVVDWLWGSGKWGIIYPQRLLGLKDDGVVGPKTIAAINKVNAKEFFEKLKVSRINFYKNIVKNNPTQKKFLNGWINRVNDLKFTN